MPSKRFLVPVIYFSNLIYHYERALFWVLAPFLAPAVFPKTDYLQSLILFFAPYELLSRPLGAIVWGWIGDRHSRSLAALLSLAGMAVATFAVGCLPSLAAVAGGAPVAFIVIRMARGFFSVGAATGVPLLLLEQMPRSERDRLSSHYEVSGMAGILVASVFALTLSGMGSLESAWRWLFLTGGILGGAQILLYQRWVPESKGPVSRAGTPLFELRLVKPMLAIAVVTGFSCANYDLIMLLMHSYLPRVTPVTQFEVQALHVCFILLDMALLPVFGRLSHLISKERLICGALVGFLCFLVPVFMLALPLTLISLLLVRLGFLVFGTAVAAPYHFWTQDLVSPEYRFRVVSMGKTLGKQLFGAPAVSLSLMLLQSTRSESGLFVYVSLLAALSLVAVLLVAPGQLWRRTPKLA